MTDRIRLCVTVAAMLPFAFIGAFVALATTGFMVGWEHVNDAING